MKEIKIKRLTDGGFKLSFYDIKEAISSQKNIVVYYKNKAMEMSWEGLESKFGTFKEPPMGMIYWDFLFTDNKEKKNVEIKCKRIEQVSE